MGRAMLAGKLQEGRRQSICSCTESNWYGGVHNEWVGSDVTEGRVQVMV
jgi:hypothetical protein